MISKLERLSIFRQPRKTLYVPCISQYSHNTSDLRNSVPGSHLFQTYQHVRLIVDMFRVDCASVIGLI